MTLAQNIVRLFFVSCELNDSPFSVCRIGLEIPFCLHISVTRDHRAYYRCLQCWVIKLDYNA